MTAPAASRNRAWLPAYLAFFVALSFAKAPQVLIEPRFWAEDGAFYFVDFTARAPWDVLTFAINGNYQFLTNVLVYLATKVPLAYAPAVTTYGAYLVELLVVALIHAVVASYGINRLVGLLLVAAWALMPASYETWASATNVQWLTSVSMLLVLALPCEAIERNFSKTLVWTAICGLTGVTSCMLAPGYLARAWLDRSRQLAVLGTLLAICALIQLVVLARHGVSTRTFTLDPRILTLPALLQTVFVPLLGVDWAQYLAGPLRVGARAPSALFYLAGMSLMLFAVGIAWRAQRAAAVLVLASMWILVSLVNTFGALGNPLDFISGKGGARYYLLGAMCFCVLLAIGTTIRSRAASVVAAALLALVAAAGLAQIRSDWTVMHIDGPSWRRELAKCAPSAPCVIPIWPSGWSVKVQSAR